MPESDPHADELLSASRVLCVQPHYDDNDIGAGGTFAALADAGVEVHYLTVADDLKGVLDRTLSDADATAQLESEQLEAGRIVGVHSQHLLNLPDAGRWDEVELRTSIIERIRVVRPDYVFTCDPRLPNEMHRDHLRVGIATGEAVLFYRMPRFETSPAVDAAYVPHVVKGLVLYYTLDHDFVFDISSTRARKHAALDCYRAQFDAGSLQGLHRAIEAMERRWAEGRAFSHGEALRMLRPHQLHVGIGG